MLVVDADAASMAELEAIRRDVGSAARKVDGFVWVSRDLRHALRAGGMPAGPARLPPQPSQDVRSNAA